MKITNKKKTLIIITSSIVALCTSLLIGYTFSTTSLEDEVTKITKQRIAEIRATGNTDISGRTGKVYYFSDSGNDSNDGLSASSPKKSLQHLRSLFTNNVIKDGDTILFNRGDIFRGYFSVNKNDILVGSYGDAKKSKPKIYGSMHDGAKEGTWENVYGDIWVYKLDGSDQVFTKDVGEVWVYCNKGNNNCDRTSTMGDLKYKIPQKRYSNDNVEETPENLYWLFQNDLDFYHMGHSANNNTNVAGALYIKSNGNPAERFDEIEFSYGGNVIGYSGVSNLHVDNIEVRYAGKHGIGGGTTANLTVSNCELSFIGGMVQKYDKEGHWPVRLGNAIEIYGSIKTVNSKYPVTTGMTVENTYVYEVIDAGLTFQYTAAGNTSSQMERIDYKNNVVENCSYNIEYWNTVKKPTEEMTSANRTQNIDNTYINKFYIRNNIFRGAGVGFSETRGEHGYEALIKSWDPGAADSTEESFAFNKLKGDTGEYIIENNIFDKTGKLKDNQGNDVEIWMFQIDASNQESLPVFKNNKFYNYNGKNLGQVMSYDEITWQKKCITYDSELSYENNLFKENNKFYSYNDSASPTGTKNGTVGNVTWNLNFSTRTLTISGSGDMSDFTADSLPPWNEYAKYIHKIVIGENVTKLGKYAFYNLTRVSKIEYNAKNLQNMNWNYYVMFDVGKDTTGATLTIGADVENIPDFLTMPNNGNNPPHITKIEFKGNKVTYIGKYAFAYVHVTDFKMPDSVTTLGVNAFNGAKTIKVMIVSNNVETIPKNCFYGVTGLERLILGANTKTLSENSLYGLNNLDTIVIQNEEFVFPTDVTVLNTFNDLYPLVIYGPSSLESTITGFNTQAGYDALMFVDLINYRPVIYGDHETFYALFDEVYINESTTFTTKALNNGDVTVTNAYYRYVDNRGFTHKIDGLNISGNTINNIIMDVGLEGTISNVDHKSIDPQTVVFMGNSLLRGFDTHGMASTTVKDDYYYYVMQYLKSMNPNLTTVKYTANPWEGLTTTAERSAKTEEFITYIKNNKGPNPVKTIFLEFGDNVNTAEKRATFQTDTINLINRLKEEFPEAKIYFLYGWYSYNTNNGYVKAATEATGIDFIDYSVVYRNVPKKQFRGVTPGSCYRFTSYVGAKYINAAKYRTILKKGGGETHPGDYGFISIADIVITYLKEHNYGTLETLTSNTYTINSTSIKAKPFDSKLTRDVFLNNIVSSKPILLYNLNNNEVTSNVNIGTGFTLVSGTYNLKIILKGDVTGDGTINLGDVSKLYNYHRGKITMDNYQIEAGKVTNNSSVTLGDVSKLYNYFKGRISNLD